MIELLDSFLPTGGRHRQLSTKPVLLGVMAALDDGRPAQLAAGHRALVALPVSDQLRLGAACFSESGIEAVTYRQFSDAFSLLISPVDPSPVPSFRGVAEDDRRSHLVAARAGVDAEACRARLFQVTDALLEESIPVAYRLSPSSLAVDWTDHETFARPRAKDDPQPADPDASWGHAKRNAPGAKDCLFYGYYGQVATMVRDEGGEEVPELVRRSCIEAPRLDPAKVMAETLCRAAASGLGLGDVLADCGYSNREPQNFARPLRQAGARLVFDLHPKDRGPKGTFEGAICSNGRLYCPATPPGLLTLGPLKRGASPEETARHDEATEELSRYKLSRISGPDKDGYERVICPAAAGRLRCPLKASSMALQNDRPSVLVPPLVPPRCCSQQTITVPAAVNEKTAQAHDYASRSHRLSYNRRTSAERSFSKASDPSRGGIRRGWCRLFGLTKNTLMYALYFVVINVRLLESFEVRKAEEARRAATGSAPRTRRRRRRYEKDDGATSKEAPEEVPFSPD
ncbi:MAG: hypothetical protein ACRD0B_04160 [Acidimicrobiales bacterium]